MPSQREMNKVLDELLHGLSPHAIKKLMAPGLAGVSREPQVKFWRMYFYGTQDDAEFPWKTAAEDFVGDTVVESAIATLEDLGFSPEQMLTMSVPRFRQLLEEHWVEELERVGPP